ncbi:MAG TPA: hypothetical protein DCX95_05830 [Elusimicrobia bacterium]|nr:hypothetical protein [Elusimicrobiota bacterium]
MKKIILMAGAMYFTLIWQTVWSRPVQSQDQQQAVQPTAPANADMKSSQHDMQSGQDEVKKQEVLKQKRAEVFKEMGWKEGKYSNKKEEELTDKFNKVLNKPNRKNFEISDLFMLERCKGIKGNANLIRPCIEIIFDNKSIENDRISAIGYLGLVGDKKAIPVLKKYYNEFNTSNNEKIFIGDALYRLSEKQLSLKIYEQLIKDGIIISNKYFTFMKMGKDNLYTNIVDEDVKSVLLKVIDYNNNPAMRIQAAKYLYHLGEKEIALKVADEIEKYLKSVNLNTDMGKETQTYYDLFKRTINMGIK